MFIGSAMSASMPYVLGIHSTTPHLGLCLLHPESGMRIQTWDLGRDMSTQLHSHLFSFIDHETLGQLTCIAVASGPGGFTSTRLGVVTARTLAQQLGIPLFGISSLAAFAWHAKDSLSGSRQRFTAEYVRESSQVTSVSETLESAEKSQVLTAVQMPARRGQVFGAIYGIGQAKKTSAMTSGDVSEAKEELLPPSKSGSRERFTVHQIDHVLPAEEWDELLQSRYPELVSMEATGPLGYTVSSVVDLAVLEYYCQTPGHWSQVYPFYGQSPV